MPLLSPAGVWRFWSPVDFAAVVPEGVACFLCRLLPPAFTFFFAPIPPDPLPAGKGEIFSFLMQGASPLASPGLNLRFAAKPIEQPFYWQCRQPRRGGTGGDGTIRRKRRRRLRWSSPPGQVEQVPLGVQPHPPNTPCPTNGNLKKILQCIKSLDLTSRVWYNNGGSVSETILIL